jgi:hypothetical protein
MTLAFMLTAISVTVLFSLALLATFTVWACFAINKSLEASFEGQDLSSRDSRNLYK